jgi:hypothetical protein
VGVIEEEGGEERERERDKERERERKTGTTDGEFRHEALS